MIDIIIPLHNGYKYFKKCNESIFYNTKIQYRIIVVNDKSYEKKLLDYLKKLRNKSLNLIIIENSSNLGFVQSVNKGMLFSKKNDVVILNSDTIVTSNWLEKLQKCAYSNKIIATVTPLSNNATICSVPTMGRSNSIPNNFSIDTFAELIEKKGLGLYPQIPTAVGFCMYIKRDILNSIGYFNEKLFDKGYGEENDFCMRVKKAGYINVIDDKTFIYHRGNASFSNEVRTSMMEKNSKILAKLYPNYYSDIKNFYRENPLAPIHKNIFFWLKNWDYHHKNILFVKHFEPNIGGVGINTLQIIKTLSCFNCYILSPTREGEVNLEKWSNEKCTGLWRFKIKKPVTAYSFNNQEIETLFIKILNYFDIKLVHFQHLLGLPLGLIKVPRKLQIPSIFSIHDYFLLSNNPHLETQDTNGESFYYDHAEKYVSEVIKNPKETNLNKFEIQRFRYISKLIENVDVYIAPSHFVKRSFSKIFPKLSIKLIEHGTDILKQTDNLRRRNKKISVAFIGAGALDKGILDYIKLSQEPSLKQNFNWKIIGHIDPRCYHLAKVSGISDGFKNIKITGPYKVKNLPKIIRRENISLAILPYLTPETYSFTLSECIQCNIPVIGRSVGALGERIKKNQAGWTFLKYTELVSILLSIVEDQNLLQKQLIKVKRATIYSSQKMVAKYQKIYDSLTLQNNHFDINADLMSNKQNENNVFFYKNINNFQYSFKNSSEIFPPYNKVRLFIKNLPIVGPSVRRIYRTIKFRTV